MKKWFPVIVAMLVALGSGAPAVAAWPERPLTLVVPFAPGGASDILARLVGERLGARLGQPVLIDNRPGAGTMLASEHVARAAPDGYTLLLAASSLGIAPSLYRKVNYDPIRDFAPVTQLASVVHVLVVRPGVPASNVGQLIGWLKSPEAAASYGSVGSGTSTHLEMELFKKLAGVDAVHVPYKGSAPALNDMVGGQLQLMFDAWASSGPFVRDGRIRLLAVTTAKRSPTLPDVPTVAESGLPGYSAMPWLGIVAPAGTPAPVVQRLHADLVAVLNEPATRKRLEGLGLDVIGNTPAEFAAFLRDDIDKWSRVVRESGAQVD